MNDETGRRRFLELAGTGTALSLAGCASLQNDAGTPTGTATEDTADKVATVAVAVRPDQATLEQERQKVRSELRAGNISRSEAQQRIKSVQEGLRSDAVLSFTTRASSNPDLTVEDSISNVGVLLVTGPSTALIEALSFDEVNALLPKATFDRVKSQSQSRSRTQTRTRSGTDTTTPG